MTLQAALENLIQAFGQAGMDNAAFEARQLAQECLEITFAQILSHPERTLTQTQLDRLSTWQTERVRGVPLAYLSGRRGFYKYDFYVGPGVLIPRPETELVVEAALRRLEEREVAERIADLGCGTGCIGLSVLAEHNELELWAIDQSPEAIDYTKKNAAALDLTARVRVEQRSVLDWVPDARFDLIVANPPYIAEGDTNVQPTVRQFEPAAALFAGEDGFEFLRQWSTWALRHLVPGGIFVCEFGSEQGRLMQDLIGKLGFLKIQIERDLAGFERVVSAVKRGGR